MTRDPGARPVRRLLRALALVGVVALAAFTSRGSTLDWTLCAVEGGAVGLFLLYQLARLLLWGWELDREARRPIDKVVALQARREARRRKGEAA